MSTTTFSGPVASQNGFIENSFTTAQRDAIADPQEGLLIYNTTTNTYEVYNGTSWQDAFAPPAPGGLTFVRGVDYSGAAGGGEPTLQYFGACNFWWSAGSGAWLNQESFAAAESVSIGDLVTFTISSGTYTATITSFNGASYGYNLSNINVPIFTNECPISFTVTTP